MMKIEDFMTKKVSSVSPSTPLGTAAQLLSSKRLSGLPVLDKDKKVVGIITEYDLVTKNQLHLPTFMKLLNEFDLYKNDKSLIKDDLKKILSLTVADVMNKQPLTLRIDATLDEASKIFSEHHSVNPIPIVDNENRLVGVFSRYDLIRLYGSGQSAPPDNTESESDLDHRMDKFLTSFEKDFILVTKARTKYWLFISILFAIIGFIIAFALIVKIVPQS